MANYAEGNDQDLCTLIMGIFKLQIWGDFETYLVKRIAASYDGIAGGNASANFGA